MYCRAKSLTPSPFRSPLLVVAGPGMPIYPWCPLAERLTLDATNPPAPPYDTAQLVVFTE